MKTVTEEAQQFGYNNEGVESEMDIAEEDSRKHNEEMSCGKTEMGEEDQKVEFWIDLPLPSWRCVQEFRGHDAKALIPEGTLGAAVVPYLQSPQNTYAVAANMLDLGFGSATRVECLTLFPPGENWVRLGLVAYGLGGYAAAMRKCGGDEEEAREQEQEQEQEQFFPVDVKQQPFMSSRVTTATKYTEGLESDLLLSDLSLGEGYVNLQQVVHTYHLALFFCNLPIPDERV